MSSIYEDIRWLIHGYFGLDIPVYNEGITAEDEISIGIKVKSTTDISPNNGESHLYNLMIMIASNKDGDARGVSESLSKAFNTIKTRIHPSCGVFAITATRPILMSRLVGGDVIYMFNAFAYKS